MYPDRVNDQFETFVNTVKEKCCFSSANLLELVNGKENEYILSFTYTDSTNLLESKPMKKDQLFEFLDKMEKFFECEVGCIWNDKNRPLCNNLGYFELDGYYWRKVLPDTMTNIELIQSCGTTHIKCNALCIDKSRVYFHKADKFYKITKYCNSNYKNANIETGLMLLRTLHKDTTHTLTCGNEEKITNLRGENSKLFIGMVLFCVLASFIFMGSFACIDYLKSQHKNTILQQTNLIKDLQIQIANLTLERDNAVNLLNIANIKIDKISAKNAEFAKGRIISDFIALMAVISCLFLCIITYNGIKSSIDNVSLVCKHDKYSGTAESSGLGKPVKIKEIDSNKFKESDPFLIGQNNLKGKRAKPLRKKFTTKSD